MPQSPCRHFGALTAGYLEYRFAVEKPFEMAFRLTAFWWWKSLKSHKRWKWKFNGGEETTVLCKKSFGNFNELKVNPCQTCDFKDFMSTQLNQVISQKSSVWKPEIIIINEHLTIAPEDDKEIDRISSRLNEGRMSSQQPGQWWRWNEYFCESK